MNIKVGLAEDQLLFRKGLIQLLKDYSQIEVTLEAENGKDLLEKLEQLDINLPQVLLMDISMPEMNGIEAFNVIRCKYPSIKVIILSVHQEDRYIVKVIEMGANGYLLKNAEPSEVVGAVNAVVERDYYFNEKIIHAIQKGLRKKATAALSDTLTNREKEILELICQENTANEIAAKLFISERTVEGHRNNLLQKTGARNTAGLVIYAIRNNFFVV